MDVCVVEANPHYSIVMNRRSNELWQQQRD
jgi:hypothetical protein